MTDDGLNIGVLYAGGRPPYVLNDGSAAKTLTDLEMEFHV